MPFSASFHGRKLEHLHVYFLTKYLLFQGNTPWMLFPSELPWFKHQTFKHIEGSSKRRI